MLAKYLTKLRSDRVLSEAARSVAIGQLGENWKYQEKELTKEFLFPTYEGANNFLLRFNDYCSKINVTPKWRNVYNTVNVTLTESEFENITTQHIEVANYLDEVYDVTLNYDDLIATQEENISEVLLPKIKRRILLQY
mmetsp:Transcript_27058/g.23905  ORF Transcript_27058/g.23905 Transcript_27058/m.23905 type:complete len:138 (+) Transcript_27058:21-434(+)